jgi:nucleotide-binding universal stress UspA family protein
MKLRGAAADETTTDYPEIAMNDIKRILVVSRSTQYCRFAVDCGISLARRFGAELSVLHLVSNPVDLEAVNAPDLFMTYNVPNTSIQDYLNIREEAKKRIDRIISEESREGIPIKTMIKDGKPADEVEKAVREGQIDLLVMLAHEEGRLEHLLFGGDNDAIIRRLPCSLLLVKKEPGP